MCDLFAYLKPYAAGEWPAIFVLLRVEKDFKLYYFNHNAEHFHGAFVKWALVVKFHKTLMRYMKV